MGNLRIDVDLGEAIQRAGEQALLMAAEHVLGVAVDRVPHEEGTLQDTGATSVDTDKLQANVTFDGPYAVRQHEELDWKHDEGRQAKYLESAVLDEVDTVAAIMGEAAREALGG